MIRDWRSTVRGVEIALASVLLTPVPMPAQQGPGPRLEVLRETLLSEPTRPGSLVEPSIAANPRDPRHLIAAGMWITARTPFDSSQRCVIYVSRDGGSSWKATAELLPQCGDPFLGIGVNGTAHFVALGLSGMVAHRSADGGDRWITSGLSLGRG